MSTQPKPGESQPANSPDTGFHSYIPPSAQMREYTPRAIILGAILGIVFGASSLYLVLKVGITVSASIPVAVISLALFRLWANFGTAFGPLLAILLSILLSFAVLLLARIYIPSVLVADFVAGVVLLL